MNKVKEVFSSAILVFIGCYSSLAVATPLKDLAASKGITIGNLMLWDTLAALRPGARTITTEINAVTINDDMWYRHTTGWTSGPEIDAGVLFFSPTWDTGKVSYKNLRDYQVDQAFRMGWDVHMSHLTWGGRDAKATWLYTDGTTGPSPGLYSRSDYESLLHKFTADMVGRYSNTCVGLQPDGDDINKAADSCHRRGTGKKIIWSVANEFNDFLPGHHDASAACDAASFCDYQWGDFWLDKLNPDPDSQINSRVGGVGNFDVDNPENIRSSYLAKVFSWAREADPDAILILNNYSNESPHKPSAEMSAATISGMKKTIAAINLVSADTRGKKLARPLIDGVGMQMHLDAANPPTRQDVIATMREFTALGVDVYITELDVNVMDLPDTWSLAKKFQREADIYRAMADACLAVPARTTPVKIYGCKSITTWDSIYSNIHEQIIMFANGLIDAPSRYIEKPAYWALRGALDEIPDDDGDGVPDNLDAFPFNPAASIDADGDGKPDAWNYHCDVACQNDSALELDTAPGNSKDTWADFDNDPDNDDVIADVDNCPNVSNPDQADLNRNGVGEACEDPLLADGKLDNTFGVDGKLQDSAAIIKKVMAVIKNSNGNYQVAGIDKAGDPEICNYSTSGQLPASCRYVKGISKPILAMSWQSSTRLLVAAALAGHDTKIKLSRFLETGKPDRSRLHDIVIDISSLSSAPGYADLKLGAVAIQTHFGVEKILVAGSESWPFYSTAKATDFAIRRYELDGTLDTTFGVSGETVNSFGTGDAAIRSLAIQDDGKIIAGGYAFYNIDDKGNFLHMANTRLNCVKSGGPKDNPALHIFPCSKKSYFAVARYLVNGGLDTTFSNNGMTTTPTNFKADDVDLTNPDVFNSTDKFVDSAAAVAATSNGKIIAAGSACDNSGLNCDFALVRFDQSGLVDPHFGYGKKLSDFSGVSDKISAIAIEDDDRIIAVGSAGAGLGMARYLEADGEN